MPKPSFKPKNKSKKNQALWLYGNHACLAALANPKRHCKRLLLTAQSARTYPHIASLPIATITDAKNFSSYLPPQAIHQQIALETLPLGTVALEDITSLSPLIILDQVTDPQNVGAILRSAAAFNAGAVILPKDHSPPESGALAKAASGALEHIPLVRVTNLAQTIKTLKQEGYWCIGMDGYAKESLTSFSLPGQTVFIFGAEGKGLRRLTHDLCDHHVYLPISKKVESLNVSNAVAVTLYHYSITHKK